jgi:hypothetical protein
VKKNRSNTAANYNLLGYLLVWKVLMAWILRLASPSAGQPHYTVALGTRAFEAKVEWTSGLVYRCVATTIAQATNIVISARGGTETSSAASTAG